MNMKFCLLAETKYDYLFVENSWKETDTLTEI